MEEWRDVPGYEGRYQVSNLGSVKSLNYLKKGNEAILRRNPIRGGYLQVKLMNNGKTKNCLVHRLVWEAFNGKIPEGYEINHLNEDKTDCRLINLSLITHKENVNWGTGNKRRAKTLNKRVEQYTRDGAHICTWFSLTGIEEELGYHTGHISACCSGKRKSCGGYTWKYAE